MAEARDNRPDSDAREARIGQLLDEFLERRARGEPVDANQLLARHPDLADELRQHLALLRDLRPPGATLESLIAQGVLARTNDPRYLAELGAYGILAVVGRGGMGVVLKAVDLNLGRVVALKLLHPGTADDPALVARLMREAKTAAGLRHPNVVTVYAIGQERGAHFLAMEYVAGPTLAEVIRAHGPLPGERARDIFRQLLSGLAAAHACGLIHRDIKSSNILLDRWPGEPRRPAGAGPPSRETTEDGSGMTELTADTQAANEPAPSSRLSASMPSSLPIVKIADFGLARLLTAQTALTLPHAILGTPEYMSPEQARGDADIDQRSDLYSAGVVLYEMLTGRTPFRADTPTAVIHRILTEEPAHPRTFAKQADPNLAALALRLMAKQSADRLGSAGAVLALLDAHRRIPSPEKRRRWLQRLALLAIASALFAGTWPILRGGESRRFPKGTSGERASRITAVEVDEQSCTTILARWGEDGVAKTFHAFPPETERVRDVQLVDVDEQGRQAVVAGLLRPVDGARANLVALDPHGEELWARYLGSDQRWPDCQEGGLWSCTWVVPADLDDEPGQELIVLASDAMEYPTSLSLIDPRDGRVRATFWHMGDLGGIQIEPDCLDGRPAVLAWGVNNKLDGFDDPPPQGRAGPLPEAPPLVGSEFVPVLMILDPLDMDGLGPPRTSRLLAIPAAPVHAYAFLDLPAAPWAAGTRRTRVEREHSESSAHIASVDLPRYSPDQDCRPWKQLAIRGDSSEPPWLPPGCQTRLWEERYRNRYPGRAALEVDRDLNLCRVVLTSSEIGQTTEEDWRQRWHVLIQRGEYKELPALSAEHP